MHGAANLCDAWASEWLGRYSLCRFGSAIADDPDCNVCVRRLCGYVECSVERCVLILDGIVDH